MSNDLEDAEFDRWLEHDIVEDPIDADDASAVHDALLANADGVEDPQDDADDEDDDPVLDQGMFTRFEHPVRGIAHVPPSRSTGDASGRPAFWMHEDASATDSSPCAGPSLNSQTVRAYYRDESLLGMCPTFAFTSKGEVVTASFCLLRPRLLLLDPDGREILASARIPRRKGIVRTLVRRLDRFERRRRRRRGRGILREYVTGIRRERFFRDTTGGAYFFVGADDRIILPTAAAIHFYEIERGRVPRINCLAKPAIDALAARTGNSRDTLGRFVGVMPMSTEGSTAWSHAWVVTTSGFVGTLDLESGAFGDQGIWLRDSPGGMDAGVDETVQNSFSTHGREAFVATSHALYRVSVDSSGRLSTKRAPLPRLCDAANGEAGWSRGTSCCGQPRDRNCPIRPKPGQIDLGTGTTPTVIDGRFVAVTDGLDRMRLRVFCAETLVETDRAIAFPSRGERSACENSVAVAIKDGRTRLVVANSYGYRSPFTEPDESPSGLSVFELDKDGKLTLVAEMDVPVWTATPKYSAASGLVFLYAPFEDPEPAFNVAAIDPFGLPSPTLAFRIPVFRFRSGARERLANDNCWATFALGPSGKLFCGIGRGYFVLS